MADKTGIEWNDTAAAAGSSLLRALERPCQFDLEKRRINHPEGKHSKAGAEINDGIGIDQAPDHPSFDADHPDHRPPVAPKFDPKVETNGRMNLTVEVNAADTLDGAERFFSHLRTVSWKAHP